MLLLHINTKFRILAAKVFVILSSKVKETKDILYSEILGGPVIFLVRRILSISPILFSVSFGRKLTHFSQAVK